MTLRMRAHCCCGRIRMTDEQCDLFFFFGHFCVLPAATVFCLSEPPLWPQLSKQLFMPHVWPTAVAEQPATNKIYAHSYSKRTIAINLTSLRPIVHLLCFLTPSLPTRHLRNPWLPFIVNANVAKMNLTLECPINRDLAKSQKHK